MNISKLLNLILAACSVVLSIELLHKTNDAKSSYINVYS